jgi:hypothetical protein
MESLRPGCFQPSSGAAHCGEYRQVAGPSITYIERLSGGGKTSPLSRSIK